jgi:hypothetical protein
LELLFELVGARFERAGSLNASVSPDLLPVTYKQLYDASGDKGASINSASVYIIGFVADGTAITDTIYGGAMHDDLKSEYDNLYDYFTDLSHGCLKTLWYDYDTDTLDVIDLLHDSSVALDEENLTIDEFKYGSEVLQKAAGEPTETIDDDVTTVEVTSQGSRAKDSAAIPVVFNNTPVSYSDVTLQGKQEYGDYAAKFDMNNSYDWTSEHQLGGRLRNFYYKATPTADGNNITNNDKFIRVHEWAQFDLGDSIDSDDICTFSAKNIVSGNKYVDASREEAALRIQQESGYPYIVANTYLELFGGKKQCKLAATCPLNEGVSLTEANDSVKECQWFYPRAVRFDPATLNPTGKTMYDKFRTNSTTYAEFNVTKVEADLVSEEVSFEGISRTYYA